MTLYWIKRDASGAVSGASRSPFQDATEIVDETHPDLIAFFAPKPTTANDVRTEAERRISSGILVNGKPFRCDQVSKERVAEMAKRLAEKPAGATQEFKTFAGDTFVLNAAQAAILDAAMSDYRGAIIGASSGLQDNPPADPSNDAHWPAKTQVTLP